MKTLIYSCFIWQFKNHLKYFQFSKFQNKFFLSKLQIYTDGTKSQHTNKNTIWKYYTLTDWWYELFIKLIKILQNKLLLSLFYYTILRVLSTNNLISRQYRLSCLFFYNYIIISQSFSCPVIRYTCHIITYPC